jgi:hypothetical protein
MNPLKSLRLQMETFTRLYRMQPSERRFLCIEDLVLQHGTVFRRAVLPPPVEPLHQACFQQSYRLATRKGARWVYCEGYALSKAVGLGVLHAWVTRADKPGDAYDLAWDYGTRKDTAYLGIPFRPEYVREVHHASKREMFSVLDAWWMHYPLITGETRVEDVMWTAPKEAK